MSEFFKKATTQEEKMATLKAQITFANMRCAMQAAEIKKLTKQRDLWLPYWLVRRVRRFFWKSFGLSLIEKQEDFIHPDTLRQIHTARKNHKKLCKELRRGGKFQLSQDSQEVGALVESRQVQVPFEAAKKERKRS